MPMLRLLRLKIPILSLWLSGISPDQLGLNASDLSQIFVVNRFFFLFRFRFRRYIGIDVDNCKEVIFMTFNSVDGYRVYQPSVNIISFVLS